MRLGLEPLEGGALRRIFEIDPTSCLACGAKMKIVSVITEPNVIDAILRDIARTGGRGPCERRPSTTPAPPYAGTCMFLNTIFRL
jgi:hypothetical protein